MSILKREPVAVAAGFDGIVKAVIAVAIGFEHVAWTETQTALVLALETAVVGFIMLFVRGAVAPNTPG